MAHRVLLVDDNSTQRRLIELHLRAEGYDVVSAAGAEDAMTLLRQSPPDVVLSDVVMGEIDGFRLCQMVRAYPPTAGVPVVLASAHCEPGREAQLAAAVGATTIVERSPDLRAELDALRRALDGRLPTVCGDNVAPEAAGLHGRWACSELARLSTHMVSTERYFRTVFEHSHDAIAVFSEAGTFLEVNPSTEKLLGVPARAMVGRHFDEFAAPGFKETNRDLFRRSLDEPGVKHPLVVLARPDGRVIQLAASTTRIELDGQVRIVATGRDITEEREAQRRLIASERRYRSLLDNIPDAVWSSTLDGVITFMSPTIERIYGLSAEAVCQASVTERLARIHPEDMPQVSASYAAARDGSGPAFDVEYRFRHASGEWIWIHNRGRIVIGSDDTRRFEGLISDITRRKRLEEQAQQLQKMEAIGQLTAGVAHDFNNILASILTNAQCLAESLADHDPRRGDVEEIRFAGERAAQLTRQLLAFSRKQVLAPTVIDLDEVVAGLEKMLRRLIGEDVELAVGPARGARRIHADVGQIEQIVMNLCVNARDAMPRGGRLTIECDDVVVDDEAARREGLPEGSYVRLSVGDTGCGMDEVVAKRCFEPFFTTKEVGKGTGLGLSTCYGIVQQAGGHIRVESTPGVGTTFRVYFPPTEANQPATDAAAPASPATPARGTETILLIEDDDMVRSAVRRLLVARGYKVIVARAPAEALKIAQGQEATIDLVVTDLIMPGGTGPQVVHQLREVLPPFRVLYMSGYAEHPMFAEADIDPAKNFVQKPFSNDELAQRIRDVLADRDVSR